MAKGTFKVVVAAEDGSKTYEELRILSVTKDITDFDSGVKKIISDSGPLRKTRETFLTENVVLSDGQLGIELDTGKIKLRKLEKKNPFKTRNEIIDLSKGWKIYDV